MDYGELPDEELVEMAQQGTQRGFAVLVERYWQRLVRYVQRLLPGTNDAEDIVQESFIKAYTNLRSFNLDRRFSPWMYRITHNTFVDHAKSLKRQPLPFFDPDVLFPHPVAAERPDTEAEVASVRTLLHKHLDSLESRYHEALVLRYKEGMSYRDIADILHVPVGTVSIRIKRGLEKMRAHIPKDIQ